MTTPFIGSYPNLEADASQWISNIGPDINPNPSLGFEAANLPDGRLIVTNVGNVANAGGLVSRHMQVPQLVGNNGQPTFPLYAQLSTYITIASTSAYNVSRLETDLIVVFNAAPPGVQPPNYPLNKANCSTQWNASTGQFQIDASSGSPVWSNIGGGPASITPDVEHSLVIKCAFDPVANTRSVLSITWDGVEYPVPASLQKVLNQPSNWGQVASIQKQTELVNPGAAQVIYRATTLSFSMQAF